MGAVAGKIATVDRAAWASAAPVTVRPDGCHVSTFRIGTTVLSHLEAKPVSTRLGTVTTGERVPFYSQHADPDVQQCSHARFTGSCIGSDWKRMHDLTCDTDALLPKEEMQR